MCLRLDLCPLSIYFVFVGIDTNAVVRVEAGGQLVQVGSLLPPCGPQGGNLGFCVCVCACVRESKSKPGALTHTCM